MSRILNPDGNELPNGTAQIWLRVIYLYGIPGALCLFLVYLLAINVPSAIADIAKDVVSLKQDHRDQSYYLRAICMNLAKDDTQRALCVPPEGK